MLLALALTGCAPGALTSGTTHQTPAQQGQSKAQDRALDEIVASAQSQIPTIINTSNGTYSTITITAVHPDTVSYTYVYEKQLDPSKAGAYFETQMPAIQKVCDTQVFPAMKAAGVTSGQHAQYTYLNADGSQIWSHTFSPSD